MRDLYFKVKKEETWKFVNLAVHHSLDIAPVAYDVDDDEIVIWQSTRNEHDNKIIEAYFSNVLPGQSMTEEGLEFIWTYENNDRKCIKVKSS